MSRPAPAPSPANVHTKPVAIENFPQRPEIRRRQFEALLELLRGVRETNPFQKAKLGRVVLPETSEDFEGFLAALPFTTKAELSVDQAAQPPYGTNLTFPITRYTRCHQTSGTSGRPLRWLDTPESWDWMMANWQTIYRAAGITRDDAIFFAFSFGPFIGFWLAFEAAVRLGARCIPGGGMSSVARVRAILEHRVTAICCTPTYAQHLADTAMAEGLDLRQSCVRTLIVAGEPGGSIPATRARLEAAWPGARVRDHHGMTEVGPVTCECPARPGVLHVMEDAYLPEILDPATLRPVPAGQPGELILTTLGRTGSPLIRYRTGDLVRAAAGGPCACGRHELALEGGIIGRTDDMLCVRGVNVYPSAIEEIVRTLPDIGEYQVQIARSGSMIEIALQIEAIPGAGAPAALAEELQRALQLALSLRIPVTLVAPGTLPRHEMKARRWLTVPGPGT